MTARRPTGPRGGRWQVWPARRPVAVARVVEPEPKPDTCAAVQIAAVAVDQVQERLETLLEEAVTIMAADQCCDYRDAAVLIADALLRLPMLSRPTVH